MAKKAAKVKKMSEVAEPQVKPVRLDLTPQVHQMLRLAAARGGMSMAAFARRELERLLREMLRKGEIKL